MTDTLFDLGVLPWTEKSPVDTNLEFQNQRARLLVELAESHLGRIEAKVADILRRHPETRDSDVALAIRYWRRWDAETLANWNRLELEALFELENLESIGRARRRIQNDYGLFKGTIRTALFRVDQQIEFSRFAAEQRDKEPEIRFFIDETGTGDSSPFCGIGGVAVIDWRQYEKFHAAFTQWRERQQIPGPLHFSEITSSTELNYTTCLSQLQKYRPGLLFLGYSTASKATTNRTLSSLIVHMVCDAVDRLKEHGCLDSAHAITVIKEQEAGFDSQYLEPTKHDLHHELTERFPNKAYLRDITPRPKGSDVLLELADLIAGTMQRKHHSSKSIHKDRVSEAVSRVTGLDNSLDTGALFTHFTI